MYFQVWRPSSSVGVDGCYSLVGENTFTDVIATRDGQISKTVPQAKVIHVEPGDVVGYYTRTRGDSDGGGGASDEGGGANDNAGIRLDESYGEDRVWYHTNTEEDPLMNAGPACPFPVGSDKILRSLVNAAPMFSIDMGE